MRSIGFYSFKGGVGRTNLLVNVAYALARRGQNVGLLDLDLEAPGLTVMPDLAPADTGGSAHRVLPPDKGLWHFLAHGGFALAQPAGSPADPPTVPQVAELFYETKLAGDWDGHVFLAPAWPLGQDDSQRYREVAGDTPFPHLDTTWEENRNVGEDLFRYLRSEAAEARFEVVATPLKESVALDYLLCDLRTGLTELRNTAAGTLFDELVVVSALNTQNVTGMVEALEHMAQTLRSPTRQPVRVIVVFSPVPTGELDIARERLAEAHRLLRRLNEKLLDQRDRSMFLHLPYFEPSKDSPYPRFWMVHYAEYIGLKDSPVVRDYPETRAAEELLRIAEHLHRIGPWNGGRGEEQRDSPCGDAKEAVWAWAREFLRHPPREQWPLKLFGTKEPDWTLWPDQQLVLETMTTPWPIGDDWILGGISAFSRLSFRSGGPQRELVVELDDNDLFEFPSRAVALDELDQKKLAEAGTDSVRFVLEQLQSSTDQQRTRFRTLLGTLRHGALRLPDDRLGIIGTHILADWVRLLRRFGAEFNDPRAIVDAIESHADSTSVPAWAWLWSFSSEMARDRPFPWPRRSDDDPFMIDLGTAALERLANYDQPADVTLWFELAERLHRKGLLRQAVQAYGMVHRLAPECLEARWRLGGLLMDIGEFEEAEPHLRMCAQQRPSAAAWTKYGHLLMNHLERLPEAREAFEHALRMDEHHVQALASMVILAFRERKPFGEPLRAVALALEEMEFESNAPWHLSLFQFRDKNGCNLAVPLLIASLRESIVAAAPSPAKPQSGGIADQFHTWLKVQRERRIDQKTSSTHRFLVAAMLQRQKFYHALSESFAVETPNCSLDCVWCPSTSGYLEALVQVSALAWQQLDHEGREYVKTFLEEVVFPRSKTLQRPLHAKAIGWALDMMDIQWPDD